MQDGHSPDGQASRPVRLLAIGVGVLLLAASVFTDAPYLVSSSGPVIEVAELVTVDDPALAPIDGDFLLLTARFDEARWVDVVAASFRPGEQLVSEAALFGGEDRQAFMARQEELFAASVSEGVAAGLSSAGAALGPDEVEVDDGGVAGPSAGLVIALAVADLASPDDLAAGRRVAVTGTIEPGGAIGEVGGMDEKVAAAVAADADLLLVPPGVAAEATDLAEGRVPVVGVSTLAEAIDVLAG